MNNEQETIVLGIVGIKNMGEYDAQTNYEKLNVVTYNGSSYCAKRSTTGNLPTDTDYWQLYAEKGETGETGPEGPKPVKGVDYYTSEDKAEINVYIQEATDEAVAEQTASLENEIDVERARIDNIASLAEGSTTGDAELMDIRVGANGKTYTSAGAAVRDQFSSVEIEIDYANKGFREFDKSLFVSGHLGSDGVVATSGNNKRRCASNTIFNFNRDIEITIKQGFYIGLVFFDNNNEVTSSQYSIKDRYIIEKNKKFKIEIYRVVEDYSEIADVNTFVGSMAYSNELIGYVDDIHPGVEFPLLRNGSMGNPSNANALSPIYVLDPKKAKRVKVTANFNLPTGHYINWVVRLYSSCGQASSSNDGKLFEEDPYKRDDSNFCIIDTSFAKGFAFSFFEYDENGDVVAHRVETEDSKFFKIERLYENDPLLLPIRNGSGGDASNANMITMNYSEAFPEEFNIAKLKLDIPDVEDYTFGYDVFGFDIKNILVSSGSTHRVYQALNNKSDSNVFAIFKSDFPSNVQSFGVAFSAKNKSDGTTHQIRVDKNTSVEIEYLYVPEDIINGVKDQNIAYSRNKDKDAMLAAAVRYNKKANNSKDFCILQITDSHTDPVAESNSVKIANGFSYIDTLIHTGDFCADAATNFSQDIYNEFINCKKPFYFVCGNHDVGNRKTISNCIDNSTFYTRYIAPLVTAGLIEEGEYEEGKGYYYHDFDSYKIRLICVYEYDDPNDVDPNDNTMYIIQRGQSVISQDQAEWFCDTLNSTPSDYSVIVAMHNPFSPNADCVTTAKFNQPNWVNGYGSQRLFSTDFWADAVNAYVTRNSSYTCDMICTGDAAYLNTNNGKYFSFNYDFSSAAGSFLCFIGGHVHRDCVWQHQIYTYQKQITPICANTVNYAQCPNADIRRTYDDSLSKDSLTAIGCDTDNKKLRLVKIGQNVTENMEYRDFELIDCN